jgi:hypothetical protein
MAEQRAEKAPERTVEGLRRVGVVLYDVDPDQLACIARGQQWQATSCAATGGTAPTAAQPNAQH